jgi:hypothetical protein
MTVAAEPTCRACARRMRAVAEIAPFNGSPGLRAFMCDTCGATDSILTQSAVLPSEMAQRKKPLPSVLAQATSKTRQTASSLTHRRAAIRAR